MKMRFNLLNALLFVALAGLISCGGDDAGPKKVLVISSMDDAGFYTVNTSTGVLTDLFTPTLNSNDLLGIRSFVYHPVEKKFFAVQNYDYNASFYSIDPATGAATLARQNSPYQNGSWRTVPSLFMDDDKEMFGFVYDYQDNSGNRKRGFSKIGTNGVPTGTFIESQFDACCGLGMVHFPNQNKFVLANADSQDDGQIEFFVYDETGAVESGFSIIKFEGFDESPTTDYWWTVRSLASASGSINDDVYGILLNNDNGNSYLAKFDFVKQTVTKIADLDANGNYDFAALAFVPESALN